MSSRLGRLLLGSTLYSVTWLLCPTQHIILDVPRGHVTMTYLPPILVPSGVQPLHEVVDVIPEHILPQNIVSGIWFSALSETKKIKKLTH